MEMIGLAVIVILLALGMFFVTKFSLSRPTTISQTQSFQQQEVASRFVNTLLNTNANCSGSATFSNLLEEIARPGTYILSCPTSDSIEKYFNESVKYLLNQSVDIWAYKYDFTVRFPPMAGYGVIDINRNCTSDLEKDAAPPFVIPAEIGPIRVIMAICY